MLPEARDAGPVISELAPGGVRWSAARCPSRSAVVAQPLEHAQGGGVAQAHAGLAAVAVDPAAGLDPAPRQGAEVAGVKGGQLGLGDAQHQPAFEDDRGRGSPGTDRAHAPHNPLEALDPRREPAGIQGGRGPEPAPRDPRRLFGAAQAIGEAVIRRDGDLIGEPAAQEVCSARLRPLRS